MNENNTLVKRIATDLLNAESGSEEVAAIYRALGQALGLRHHLRPRPVAEIMNKPELPKVAPEIYQQRADKEENVLDFVKRVYRPWIGKGFGRQHLYHLDRSAYLGYKNFIAYHGDRYSDILPTKEQLIDRDRAILSEHDDPKSCAQVKDEIVLIRRIENILAAIERETAPRDEDETHSP